MSTETPTLTMKLEVVCLPVADLDRAKAYYAEQLGFHVDHDREPTEGVRFIQLTPPGSAGSIVLGEGVGEFDTMQPGTIKGLHLVVVDIVTARAALVARGVDVTEIIDMGGIKLADFRDPDGNAWILQEIPLGGLRGVMDTVDETS